MNQNTFAVMAFIKPFENCWLHAYLDIAGVVTIGWGDTGPNVKLGDIWTQGQCDDALYNRVDPLCGMLSTLVRGVSTSADEFVAMASIAYNIGEPAFRTSSVLRYHVGGMRFAAANAFLLWDKAHVDGQLVTVSGLYTRRETERTKYLAVA